MSDISLGALPRYSLVLDEDVKKPNKQTNCGKFLSLYVTLDFFIFSTDANLEDIINRLFNKSNAGDGDHTAWGRPASADRAWTAPGSGMPGPAATSSKKGGRRKKRR